MSTSDYLKKLEEIKGRAYGTSGVSNSSNESGSSNKNSGSSSQSVLERIKSRANGTDAFSSDGKKGWEKYLADQSSAEQKKAKEKEDEKWWETLGRYLGPTGATDTTMTLGNTGQIIHDVRNDTSYTKPSDDWSEEQRYEFGALYLESPEKAYAYAEKTNNANNKAKEEAEIKKIQDAATSNGWAGAGHTIGSIALSGVGGMADYLNMLVMANAGRDPLESDGIVSPFEYSTSVTEGIGTHLNETYGTLDEDIPIFGGKGWGDVYGLGTSIAQSAVSGYTLGPAGTLVSYFGQGAASGMKDALERGADDWQAAWYGAALGAFEGVAESIGIDNLFKLGSSSTIKGLLKNILQQAKAEGLEEGFTSVLSNIADAWIMQDKSNFNAMLNAYMEAGMSEKDAKWAVFWDSLEGIAFDMIAGAASGGIHGGLQTGIQTGKYSSYVKNAFGGQVEDLLIEAGQAATDETGDAVDKYINKYGEKGKLSGMNIAHLLEITDASKIKSTAETRLTQLGEKGNISQLADILTKQVQGMELSKSEQKLLDESTYGQRVANELNPENIRSGEYATNWSEQIGTRTINPKEYNKGKNVVAEGFPNKIVTKGVPEEEIATEAEIEASEEGDATLDDTISIMNNMVEKMELSDDVAGQMLEHFKPSDVQQAKLYQHAVPLAYNYGKIGYSAGLRYITSLSEQDKNYAYRRGAIDALIEADSKQSQIESSKTGSAQGTTKKKGIIYEGGYEYKEKTATPLQKSSMKAIEVINAISNLEIHVFESVEENGKRVYNLNGEKVNAPNGYFKDGNKIYIDINAGQHGEGLMLDTLGHEVTHYIRENDAKGFKVIADFLIEQYGKKGVNVEALLEGQRKKIRNRYAREGAALPSDAKLNDMAYEELVADAMSEMLSDPKAYDKLAKLKQENRNAWETLRDAIKNILDKIKSILNQYKSAKRAVSKDAVTPEAYAVRDFSADAYEKLQDLYIKAFVEADANYAAADRTLSDNGIMVDPSTESATIYSVRDVLDDDQRQNVAKALATRFNVTQKEALQWLTAETSLASLILNPKYSQYLDYVPDPNEVAIKTNSDYPQGTVDFSPICAKRREFTAVMNNVLRLFKNHVFAATDLAKIRSIMQEEGMTIPCGICYVEDRRQLDTIVAQNFIDSLKLYREGSKTRPDGKAFNTNQLKGLKLTDGDSYTPTVYELVSLEGLNVLKEKNPSMAEAWIKFNNARGMQSVRLLANEAEYKRQILKYGKQTVKAKNDKGGLRIYSFSDAEMFHLIDIIQVITDSATVGLSLQGYTKVNEYAKAVKDTGEKLNRSLIPKGELGYHIEDGKVVLDYDTVEGIDINHPDFFDNKDNPNVGNITIGVSDTQIRAAMVSDFVDQIIPFHTGQSEDVLGEKGIATWSNYKDFQTEKDIATGKVSDHQINIYTEVLQPLEKEGKPITKRTFVEKFLQVCKENNLTPRFSQFLNTNANGEFVYTEGYHKMLVDFKTFAQTETGEYLPQMPVKPIFDNGYITKILKDYVKSQEVKDAELAKSMPKVIERITNEIIKPSETKFSDRDSEGNKLSAEQIEFFKDSKVRDAEGRLVSQYHGTPNGGFTEFKLPHYLHSLTSANGAGFYFTDERNARQYMKGLNGKSVTKKKLYNVYLNITNPLEITEYSTGAISDEVFRRIMARGNYEWGMAHTDVEKLLQFNKYDTDRLAEMVKVFNGDEILTVMKEELGYDGVRYTDRYGDVWVAWDNRQIKETTNKTPTSDPDIRYSFRDSESGMANDALSPYNEELTRFIEQRGDYIVDSFEKLEQIVNLAFDNSNLKATAYFGIVNIDALEKIKNSIPNLPQASKDILFKEGKDYSIATTFDAIRHIVDDKNLSREDVINYLDRLADTILEFDSVAFNYYIRKNNKFPGLLFKKRFDDGVLISFDLVSHKKRSLVLQTLYMDSADYQKKKAAKTLLMQNASSETSETQVGQPSGNSIPQNTDSVKREFSEDIRYSDREIQPITEEEYQTLEKHFGVTGNFRVAGYLLPNGKLLDFSGKHWGDTTSRSRQVDHRDVNEVLDRGNNGFSSMVDMIGSGNIRLMPETGGINLAVYPNEKQRRVLSIYIKQMLATEGQVIVDYDAVGGDTVYSRVYEKYASSEQILRDIRNYFNGARQSDLMQFHTMYSDRDTETISNRTLLANALETTVQEKERGILQAYKDNLNKIDSEQVKLNKVREAINEIQYKKSLSIHGEEMSVATFERRANAKAVKIGINVEDVKFRLDRSNAKYIAYAVGFGKILEADKTFRSSEDTEKLKELYQKSKDISNQINEYDRELLRLEAMKPIKNVLQREKAMAYKEAEQRGKESLRRQKEKDAATVRELMARNYESRKQATESRNKTAMRHKIKNVVSDLNKLLLNPTQDKHVPIGLQKVVAEALDVINMDTMNAEERVAYYNDLISKSNNPDEIAMLKKKRDFFEYRDMNFKDRITSLKSAYAEFKESDDSLIRNAHNDAIEDLIKNTADEVGNKSLKDMSLTQLEKVYDMYKAIFATVRNANKMFKEGRQETVTENSNAVKLEVREVGGHKDRVLKMTKFLKKFGWEMLKPVTAMKVIGSKTFERLFNNVRAAEDTWAVDVNEAKQFYEDIAAKYGYNKWDLKKFYSLKDGAGADISMTLEQIMSLYAYSKREQADQHLEFGGFIFDDAIEVVEKNKILGIPLKYEVNDANPHRLRKEHLLDIISVLTKEQKDFVDAMQTYLSDVMGAKGNEVSLAMYDIKLYKEKNYFPLKTSRYFREFDPEKSGTPKIKNSGFSKKTVPQAGNPIVLSNFMDVWAGHVNDMSMYHAFVLPLEDFMRVYNYSLTAGGYDSVQQYIKNAYGSQANQYIERLLDDLNGGARVDSSAGIINKGLSLFKKASVFASASVVVQQPSAIARALAYINPKYFAKATPEALNIAKHKTLWAEVKKYAPVAIIKEMGYFDTGVGRGTVEWIKGNQTFMDKMDDVLSKAPAIADELCWTHIWEAIKRETQATSNLKVGSEIFLMECGKRFTEVITNTQVYDSVLSRSGMMRSKDTGMKMATAFMAEPTTTVNMMVDGIIQGKRGNKRFTTKTVGAVASSIILNSILVALVYAARDDDEDETYLEKYIGSLTSELLDGFNPLTYIPFVKDIWSIAQGYDVERSDMSVVSNLWESIEGLFDENTSGLEKVTDTAGAIASLFGIPLKNILRDAKGMYNLTQTILSDTPTTGAGIGEAIEDAFKSSIPLWDRLHESDSKADRLYKAIMSGDQDHIDRVKATYKSEQAYETALKSALRANDSRIHEAAQARLDGNISEYTRIAREIIAEGHFSQDTVVAAINSEMSAIKKGESTQTESTDSKDEATSIYRADDINVAFDNGDTSLALSIIDELIEMKMANGMDEKKAKSSIRSSMTSYWKPLYKQAYASGNTAEMQRIKQILYKSGLYGSATEVIKDVNSWLKN
jgi:hypothetical protein